MTEETGRYRTPGELVQAAREQRGLSLDDLAAETRIPRRMIEAVEADDFTALSSPLYARSFLKTLGEELQLDTEMLLDRYVRLTGPEDAVSDGGDDPTWETETRVLRTQTVAWRTPLTVAVVLAVAASLIWGAVAIFTEDGESAEGNASPEAAGSAAAPVSEVATDTLYDVDFTVPLDLPAGTPSLEFAGGDSCAHVLRLVSLRPVEITLRVDDALDPVAVDWEQAVRGLPESGLEPGRVYQLGERRIIYWCAAKRFRCVVPDDRGLELSYNGAVIDFTPEDLGRALVFGEAEE